MTESTPAKKVKHPMLVPIAGMRLKKGKIVTAEEAVEGNRREDPRPLGKKAHSIAK